MENYFIKLLLYSVQKDEFILIYGFSSVTSQTTYPWKFERRGKEKYAACRSILCKDDAEIFFQHLEEDCVIKVGKIKFSSPKLVKRTEVLANDGFSKKEGPVSDYRKLTEFWNIHKSETLQKMESTFPLTDSARYDNMKSLMDWAHEECGIDFLQNAYRFGNFELYDSAIASDVFKMDINVNFGLSETVIKSSAYLENDLIVNCVAKYCGRSIINQTKIFHAADNEISFNTEEPMTHVLVQIWDADRGSLIYSEEREIIDSIFVQMNMEFVPHAFKDPWSHKLKQSAPGQKETIEKNIEEVKRNTPVRKVVMGNCTLNEIHDSLVQSGKLFAHYKSKYTSGSFVPSSQSNGEIKCFLELRKYIDCDHVEKVVIADPYFSVESALKILTRINHTNIKMDIFTSLVQTDPDSGKKNADIVEQYKKYLENNWKIFPCRVRVCNLTRGGKQVFHDRYMLRYFEDGSIDGFLLSNSINSMGQRFPFVIASMDHKVCLEVQDYINYISYANDQNNFTQKERVRCDTLFDSESMRDKLNHSDSKQSQELPLQGPLSRWYNDSLTLSICPKDLPDVLSVIFEHFGEGEKEQACMALCIIDYENSSRNLLQDICDAIKTTDSMEDIFLETFSRMSRNIEECMDFSSYSIDNIVYKLKMLMQGKADLNKAGLQFLFEDAMHISYHGKVWLKQGYAILLELNPTLFLRMLEELNSPLMLSVLIERMIMYKWYDELFYIIAQSDTNFLNLICAEWIHINFVNKKLNPDKIMSLLSDLNDLKLENCLLQACYLFSRIVYNIRMGHTDELAQKQFEILKTDLLNCIAEDLCRCNAEFRKYILTLVQDCEIISNCRIHLELADVVEELQVKNELLEYVIKITREKLMVDIYVKDVSELIELYLKAFETRYKDEQNFEDKFISDSIKLKTFETATEPELKNYAYEKWNKAYVVALRQIDMLHIFCESHPDAQKAKKWLEDWECRLETMKKN